MEGDQLSLCEEDEAGDKIPQRECIYNHTGERSSYGTHGQFLSFSTLFFLYEELHYTSLSYNFGNIYNNCSANLNFSYSEILRSCVQTAVCSKRNIILFSNHASLIPGPYTKVKMSSQ